MTSPSISPECIPDGALMKAVTEGYKSKCVNCRTNAVTRDGKWVHARNGERLCHPESE